MWYETAGVNMKKRSGYLILAIVFAAFSVIAFTVPFNRNQVFWISYMFALAAMGFQIPLWNKAFENTEFKSRFLDFPILYIGIIYMIVQLIVSIAMMAVPEVPAWVGIIVDVVIFAMACMAAVFGHAAKSTIENRETKVKSKVRYMKYIQDDADIVASTEKNEEIKKELNKLADAIRFSEPMSHPSLAEIEQQISEKICQLKSTDNKTALIEEINVLLIQRNKKCQSLK